MKKLFSFIVMLTAVVVCFAQETTTISPSWSQSFKYAHRGGQTVWDIVGVVLIIVAIFGLTKTKGVTGAIVACWFVFALGVASILSKPSSVKWNNDKEVNTEYLKSVGEQHIWDSLEYNHFIIDGPYK